MTIDARDLARRLADMGMGEEDFDEAVHEWAAMEASDVNNAGWQAQITYLADRHGWCEKDFVDWIKNLHPESGGTS